MDILGEDKRKFVRIEIEFPVKLVQLDKEKDEKGQAHNLSFEGIGFSTDKEFSPDVPLELILKIPDESKLISVKGKVIWSKPIGENTYRLGVSLTSLDPSSLARALKLKLE